MAAPADSRIGVAMFSIVESVCSELLEMAIIAVVARAWRWMTTPMHPKGRHAKPRARHRAKR